MGLILCGANFDPASLAWSLCRPPKITPCLTFFFSAKTSTPPSRVWKPAKKPQAFLNVEAFQALESERKTLQTRTEELQPSATSCPSRSAC